MKKIFLGLITVVLSIVLLSGCASDSVSYDTDESVSEAGYSDKISNNSDEEMDYDGENAKEDESFEEMLDTEKIIYRAFVSIETLTFEETLNDVTGYVSSLGGFVQNSNVYGIGEKYGNTTRRASAQYVFRIPVKEFSGFMNNIANYGNVEEKSQMSENITQQYYDTDSRLKALRIQEERLLELLSKAEDVKDLLEIERELSNVRYEIERNTTQVRQWDNLVEYTTVTVNITEVREIVDNSEPDTFLEKLGRTISKSAKAFVNFVENFIIVIIYIFPYLILLALLLVVWRIIRKKNGKVSKKRMSRKEKRALKKAQKEENNSKENIEE